MRCVSVTRHAKWRGLRVTRSCRLALLIFFGVAAPSTTLAANNPPSKAEVAAKQADLGALRGRIESLQKEIAAGESSRKEAADELRESEKAISSIRKEQRRLASERRDVEADLRKLQTENRRTAGSLDEHQARLGALLRRHYQQSGSLDPLRLALSGRNQNQVQRDRRHLETIAGARQALVEDTRSSLERNQALAEQTKRQQARLEALEARQQNRHAEHRKQQSARKRVLDRVSSKLSQQRKTIGSLKRDEQHLSRLIKKLGQLIAKSQQRPERSASTRRSASGYADYDRQSAFAKLRGQLRKPILDSRGKRDPELKGLVFPGIDGAEVRAIADGQVVFSDWLRGFGNLLVIDHGEDYLSIYGNNESLLLQGGDQVTANSVIATAGNSGGRSETGLYFELRFRGEPIDPLPWFGAR